jgi:hemerythrin-like domain-containing protein
MAQLDRLEADHRQAEAAHARLDVLGRQWLATGRLAPVAHAEFEGLLRTLSATYAEHIQLEDHTVFMLAAQVLDAPALRSVGSEMKQRRIADPGRAGSRCAVRRADLADAGPVEGTR